MIAFIDDHRAVHGVEPICKLLPIAPSTYHAHLAKRDDPAKLSDRARRDAALRIEVRRVFDANFRVYGVRKIWRQLRREGFDVARCTVARLMRAMGLAGVIRGKPVRTTISDRSVPCPLDRVNRQFHAPAPDMLWVSDFTYVPTWAGFVYVAFVIDTFARRIVGWRASRTAHAGFVLDALEQPHRPHQPSDRAARNIKAFAPQLPPDLAHAIDAKVGIEYAPHLDPERGVPPRSIRQLCRIIALRHMRMVGRWGDRQNLADRLDPMDGAMVVDKRDHLLNGRSSSAIAKYADPFLRISLAWRSSRFSRSSAFSFAATSVGTPARPPASTSAFFTHSCSVCAAQPILAEIDTTAPIETHAPARVPAPSAPRARAPRAHTCSLSCS